MEIEESANGVDNISPISIESELKRSYIDYAMSVIVSRALPDIRDGLKPVHRRILYAMKEGGYEANKPFRKSARIVGYVMGKYHPHGDSAIYDSLVRMTQSFSLRHPLVEGQGNFGSMDGDSAAAMRYTEARLAKLSNFLLEDIDRASVDFRDNYDNSGSEPVVLPSRFPNLLVNGSGGIAVGMATNIPPHNLGEVIDGLLALIDNPNLDMEGLCQYIRGPDFPTGGLIVGLKGVKDYISSAKGSLTVRGRAAIEASSNRIIITEIPYQVNKSRLLERIADMVRSNRISGIGDLRDESNRQGVRIVIEVKRGHNLEVILNNLYKHTPLQTNFSIKMLALYDGRPELFDLRKSLVLFIDFRRQVIERRTRYILDRTRERAHRLGALAIAVNNLSEVIEMIRTARNSEEALYRLTGSRFLISMDLLDLLKEARTDIDYRDRALLSKEQGRAILDLRLHRLTALERDKILAELKACRLEIEKCLDILNMPRKLFSLMKEELKEIRDIFADKRRTEIIADEYEFDEEALIKRENMVVTLTNSGYIKSVPTDEYRAQKRGGKGRIGMIARDQDFISKVYELHSHSEVLFFSTKGLVYKLKVYNLPRGSVRSKGRALVNLLSLSPEETITALMPLQSGDDDYKHLIFATYNGFVRRSNVSDFVNVQAKGKIAIRLRGDDKLISVKPSSGKEDIFLATKKGRAVRFSAAKVRLTRSRSSYGLRGIRLASGDKVISLSLLKHVPITQEERDLWLKTADPGDAMSFERKSELKEKEEYILSLASDGRGKMTSSFDYKCFKNRGGKGVINRVGRKTASVVSSVAVDMYDEVILITDSGVVIRCLLKEIRHCRRSAAGVWVIRLKQGDKLASSTLVKISELNDD